MNSKIFIKFLIYFNFIILQFFNSILSHANTLTHSILSDYEITACSNIELSYFYDNKSNNNNYYSRARIRPKLNANLLQKFQLIAEGDFQCDTDGLATGIVDDYPENENLWSVRFTEFYIQYVNNNLQIDIGKKIYDWSLTDTISPSDNISPREWTELTNWERIGVPSLGIRLGSTSFIEFVYLPYFTPSKIQKNQDRWAPSVPSNVSWSDTKLIQKQTDQFASRIGTTWNSFDLAITYFNGASTSPSYKITPDLNSALIEPKYFKEEVISITGAREIMTCVARTEIGYFNQDGEEDFIQYVIGVDKDWPNLFIHGDSLYTMIQYCDEPWSDNTRQSNFSKSNDYRRLFNNSILGKIDYSFNSEKINFIIDYSYNLNKFSNYIEPMIKFILNDTDIEIGLTIFQGDKNTFFGNLNDRDRIFLRLTQNF
jgi:hypothetical protein